MYYLLFLLYLIFFCWLITKIRFFKKSGLNNRLLIGLFLIRVAVALVNAYIDLYHYPVSDVRTFYLKGLDEYHLLLHHPSEYFTNFFTTGQPAGYGRFLESSHSFWNDTRDITIAKMLAVFNIFSAQNFFINDLFYNFFIFFGCIALYRVFIKIFPGYKWIVIAIVFLLPGTIYFTSSVHRDGLIFLSLGMIIYNIVAIKSNARVRFRHFFVILLFLLLILFVRNYVLIVMIPALIAWLIAERYPKHGLLIFISTYAVAGILFFLTTLLPYQFNLPLHVASRQSDFINIENRGMSKIQISPLNPTFPGFIKNLPEAMEHSFLRPFITEHQNILYIPVSLELLAYEIIFIIFLVFRKKQSVLPIIYFCLFFSVTMFLIIGYTIPILGAIVRYRSVYFPFLLIAFCCYIDWERIAKIIHIK